MPTVYEIVTERIIAQMEKGVVPWRKPWKTELPCNMVSGKPYRGLNVFLLASQGFGSRYWLTFAQCQKLGGQVMKGEKSTLVIFWKIGQEKIVKDPVTDQERTSRPFILRYYSVFNVCQTTLAEKLGLGQPAPRTDALDAAEKIAAGMPNLPKREQSDRAWYHPGTDTVGMPARALFSSGEEYYSTLFHELTHSTGHTSRLHRENFDSAHAFGSESYSKEELVAELGASMLAGIAGIETATLNNSAAYLRHWIDRLKSDSKLLVSAASQAQKACDYILAKQDQEKEQEQVQELVNA